MTRSIPILLFISIFISCGPASQRKIDTKILSSLGETPRTEWEDLASLYESQILEDPTNTTALVGLAETRVIIYIFGFTSRSESLPQARDAFQKAYSLDSTSSEVLKMKGILSFLDWKWEDAQTAFVQSMEADSANLNARHWYSLWLTAMGRLDEAMAQSDKIAMMDTEGNFLIGRGSMFYFARRFEEMKELMLKSTEKDPEVAWGYDWLGMAYIELKEYDNSIETYFKAFELSDGTVEVGAGLGHALGQAGETALAKQMADHYDLAAKDNYLPPVQRSFVHIGIKEYDKALELLEQAYEEQSWFLIFLQIEPWYDPIRRDPELKSRFDAIINKMNFPEY